MQALLAAREAELGAAADGGDAKLAPLAQHLDDALGFRQAVEPEPGQVYRVSRLQTRMHQQRGHQLLRVLARGAGLDDEAQPGLAIALVPDATLVDLVQDELLHPFLLLRYLLLAEARLGIRQRLDLFGDLLHGNAVGQFVDHHPPLPARELLRFPFAFENERAAARFIGLPDFLGPRDDLAAAREVRPGQELEHVVEPGAGGLEAGPRRRRDFLQAMRRNAGREADRNSKAAVQ